MRVTLIAAAVAAAVMLAGPALGQSRQPIVDCRDTWIGFAGVTAEDGKGALAIHAFPKDRVSALRFVREPRPAILVTAVLPNGTAVTVAVESAAYNDLMACLGRR